MEGAALVGFDQRPSERTGQPLDAIAEWLELGHHMETHDRQTPQHGLTFVPPEPFVRPGFDASKDRAVEAFTDKLAEDLASEGVVQQ